MTDLEKQEALASIVGKSKADEILASAKERTKELDEQIAYKDQGIKMDESKIEEEVIEDEKMDEITSDEAPSIEEMLSGIESALSALNKKLDSMISSKPSEKMAEYEEDKSASHLTPERRAALLLEMTNNQEAKGIKARDLPADQVLVMMGMSKEQQQKRYGIFLEN